MIHDSEVRVMCGRQLLWFVASLAVFAACKPDRPSDFAGVVRRVDRGEDGWTVSLESDSRDTRHGAGEPMILYVSSRQARGLRVGCQMRAWFTNGGSALLSYPGQAWAEAVRIDACRADRP